jgi:hypothetical protein
MARQIGAPRPKHPRILKEVITMAISIPLVLIAGVIVYLAWRYMGLKVWHAIVCLLFGFLLAATVAGPEIHNFITEFVQWLTKP